MMRRRGSLAPIVTVLLAACGPGAPPPGTATADAGAAPQKDAPGAAASATAACNGLPPHAVLLPDARVSLCTSNDGSTGRRSGTVIYTTADSADAVFAFYKAAAAKTGLADAIVTPTSYSANEASRRTFMVLVAPADGRTQVTLNWGIDA